MHQRRCSANGQCAGAGLSSGVGGRLRGEGLAAGRLRGDGDESRRTDLGLDSDSAAVVAVIVATANSA